MRDKALSVAKHLSINVLGRTWNHPGPFDLDAALALAKSSENQQSVGSQNKLTRIIYVPEDDSEMNYLGLLIGPKGQTQKQMQAESGAKILIRGRGSSKDGHSDSFPEEPLHVYIEAESEEQIAIAEQMVNDLLFDKSKQASVKQSQLMKHAELNSSRESGFILNESLYATGADSGFPLASGGKSVSDTFVVPRDKVGHIIGRGGDTIRLLQQNTGAFIGLSKETRDDDSVTHKVFNILGSEEQVENAKSEIKRLIDEFEEKVSHLFYIFLLV